MEDVPWSVPADPEIRMYPCIAFRHPADVLSCNLDVQGRPLRPFVFDLALLPSSLSVAPLPQPSSSLYSSTVTGESIGGWMHVQEGG
eukprot:CAMPEP_0181329296 /NCGR_PEP_ID=MMETSP1101-20121128/23227_1 /TAXON_ID=46948 /ORGANISM="Rhodomonas abbreviata, Strain Caron Lab Isolate" /LENGTH=86 /DNA_ID=CAMNT_0023438349 /DNA_START=10 /DNA_END=266 /DNA_ORIENTATION=-